ncbi:hypothetical protein EJB05_27711, partial [Eragrostis curvula]
MDWRRAGSPTYGRRRSPAGIYSAPASPAHPLGPPPSSTASPVHPLAARSKARAAAAMAHAMSRPGANNYDDEDDDAGAATTTAANGRYDGGRSPLRGAYGYGGRSPLHAAAAAAAASAAGNGNGTKDKYFGFALPKKSTYLPFLRFLSPAVP